MVVGYVAAGLVLLLVGAIFFGRYLLNSYVDPWEERVARAGYSAMTTRVNQVALSYLEGPDNRPPLVVLHAQHMDWFSYSRVLPALSESFHVYDVDYPGHVRAALLEDPPLFSAEYPRIRETIAYRSFVTSHDFVEEGATDFLIYWIEVTRSSSGTTSAAVR